MSGEPERFVLACLRRIDEKLDRVVPEVQDLKQRVAGVGLALARTRQDVAEVSANLAGIQVRMDQRIDHIERRLDLAEAHA